MKDVATKLISGTDIGVNYDSSLQRDDFRSLSFDLLLNKKEKSEPFWALKGIDFEGFRGEVLGIIGSNGAGKSTLCKVISNILKPDTGNVEVKGSVSALLSMGTGFNYSLSGKDNIYLNGLTLGMSKRQIDSVYNEIVEFAGLKNFIDQPIKYYSSGMKARLGFSIAVMMEPEILVLDEALNTGDLEFSERASDKMKELVKNAKLVIIVTHNIDYIEKNCTRAIWINKGEIAEDGDPKKVASLYRKTIDKKIKKKQKILDLKQTINNVKENEVIVVEDIGVKFKLNNKDFWPLKNVSFKVNEGDIIGVIGHNGAGKSTLCRILSGIYKPDEGKVYKKGRTTSLLSLGLGFNRNLTGMDNIILSGMMMGIPKKKIHKLKDEIVEFAGLQEKIDQPIKYYSSGMKSRLGFSIAAAMQPELFIIDEALSAGDIEFKQKASERIQEMITKAKAVIVVTHNMNFVEKVCTRALWINKGRLIFDGDPKEAVRLYKGKVKRKKNKKEVQHGG